MRYQHSHEFRYTNVAHQLFGDELGEGGMAGRFEAKMVLEDVDM